MIEPQTSRPCSASEAATLYGVDAWGAGYLGVNDAGRICVCPGRDAVGGVAPGAGRVIDLHEVMERLGARGVRTPVLLRFTDVLDHRLGELRRAFDRAAEREGYRGSCACVYPIKVNQARRIVEEVRDAGARLGFGLEVGSKPELLAVIGSTGDAPAPAVPIICNGFKDEAYLEMVVLAHKLGRSIIPVIERPRELDMLLALADRHGALPEFGVRVKPSAIGAGRWEASGGIRSKFGLNISELLALVRRVVDEGLGEKLRLLHFHLGSQICDIRSIKNGVTELARTYCEVSRLGARLGMIDVGGGLGVDYDGSKTSWSGSMNYSVDEYASDVVHRIGSVCDEAGVEHPTIIAESGRAMVAYSSVLVTDVLSISRFDADPGLDEIRATMNREEHPPQPLLDLIDAYARAGGEGSAEAHHDAEQARDEASSLYTLGHLSLELRAAAERLFAATGLRVLERARRDPALREQVCDLEQRLADIAYINLSVFQSLPDSWAIGQIFPVCPIERLDELPTRHATLADLTCDSDGHLRAFSCPRTSAPKPTLELHELRLAPDGSPELYRVGFFLVGAYQEVLGDLHNLFGDTPAAHVRCNDAGWEIEEIVAPDSIGDVLRYVEYDTDRLRESVRVECERAVAEGRITEAERDELVRRYEDGLRGTTYLA